MSSASRGGSSRPNRSYVSSKVLPENESPHQKDSFSFKDSNKRVQSAPLRSRSDREYEACDVVATERKWEEKVRKEISLRNNWEKKFKFLTQYDQYGEPEAEKEVTGELVGSVLTPPSRPLTASKEYGHRVNTGPARTMLQLQLQMKKVVKRNKDLTCYD